MTYYASLLNRERNALVLRYPELTAWENNLKSRDLSPVTIESYMRTVVRFIERYNKSLLDATEDEIEAFIVSLPPASRKPRFESFASFYKFARKRRRIQENPMDFLDRPKPPRRKHIEVFKAWEQAALLQADPGRMAILLHAGLRQGEACNLQGRDINFEDQELIVRRGKGSKSRLVRLVNAAVGPIADMMLTEGIDPTDYVWFSRPGGGKVIQRNQPISESAFRRWWQRALEAAEVDYRNPHTTRHTFATNSLKAGGRIERLQEQMGHESIATTKDMYGHLDSHDIRMDVDLLDRWLTENVEVVG